MKTCVVRRRFYATEADNTTVSVKLEPNFGIPKGIVVFFTENNANTDAFDTSLEYKNLGIGFADGTNSVCVNITCRDNVNTNDTQRSHYGTRVINCVDSSRATQYYRVDTVAFSQDQVDFTFTNASPQTDGHLETIIWAVTGDDVSVGVGYSSYNATSGGTRVYSGLSFQPDFVFTAGCYATLNQTQSADAIISFGAATRSPLSQASYSFWVDDGNATRTNATWIGNTRINNYITATGTGISSTIGSFSSNGWTMTSNGAHATDTVYNFFAIKSQSPSDFALLESFATYTGTGRTFVGLGTTGFVPETILGCISEASTRNVIQTAAGSGTSGYNLFAGTATSYSKLYNGDGTITYSTASTTVTGTSSNFWLFYPGVRLYTPNGLQIGQVSSVSSDTSLTLTANASLSGTDQSYTHSNFRQHCMSYTEKDNSTNATTSHTLISSDMFTIAHPNGTTLEAYLDTNTASPGFFYNITKSPSSSEFGWVAAFKGQNENRRRGRL